MKVDWTKPIEINVWRGDLINTKGKWIDAEYLERDSSEPTHRFRVAFRLEPYSSTTRNKYDWYWADEDGRILEGVHFGQVRNKKQGLDWNKPIEFVKIDKISNKIHMTSPAMAPGGDGIFAYLVRLNGDMNTYICKDDGIVYGLFRWQANGKFEIETVGDHQAAFFVRNVIEIPREKKVRSEIETETHKAYIYEDGRIEVKKL